VIDKEQQLAQDGADQSPEMAISSCLFDSIESQIETVQISTGIELELNWK